MRVTWGAASDIGQVREGNEDSYLVLDPLYAVADGMGGHRGGEVASNLALDTIRDLFAARQGSLTEQVERANRVVFERSRADRDVSGMGTTLTAALVRGDRVQLAHVGDSRAYLLRDGELHRLTEDHTLVHRMVEEGEITEEEAETHPHRNIVTRALGVDPSVRVDERVVEVRPGDRILLCTDGLTGMVGAGRIRDVLLETPDPARAVDRLLREANDAGGVDNITAVVLDFADEDPATGATARPAASPSTERRSIPTPVAPMPLDGAASSARARLLRRVALWAGVAVAVAILAVIGLRLYLDSQWYVGVSEGRVAIFRGVPAEVVGLDLHSVVVETTIPAEDAEALAIYRDRLAEGITVDDREAADEVVAQIREDVARAALGAGP